jgi:hypothetical protein
MIISIAKDIRLGKGGTSNTEVSQSGPATAAGDDPSKLHWPMFCDCITCTWHEYRDDNYEHDGLDFCSRGCDGGKTRVYAAADGTATFVGNDGGFGNTVVIDHGQINGVQMQTKYSHLSSFSVSEGDTVSRDQQIGLTGDTGTAEGSHLHFRVLADGVPVNPLDHLGPLKIKVNAVGTQDRLCYPPGCATPDALLYLDPSKFPETLNDGVTCGYRYSTTARPPHEDCALLKLVDSTKPNKIPEICGESGAGGGPTQPSTATACADQCPKKDDNGKEDWTKLFTGAAESSEGKCDWNVAECSGISHDLGLAACGGRNYICRYADNELGWDELTGIVVINQNVESTGPNEGEALFGGVYILNNVEGTKIVCDSPTPAAQDETDKIYPKVTKIGDEADCASGWGFIFKKTDIADMSKVGTLDLNLGQPTGLFGWGERIPFKINLKFIIEGTGYSGANNLPPQNDVKIPGLSKGDEGIDVSQPRVA